MKRNIKLSLLSVLLVMAMILTSVYLPGYATGKEEISQETSQSSDIQSTNEEEIETRENVLSESGPYEVVSMRDEKTKYINLGNGKYQAVSYMDAVHRKAADGSYVDIDNRLTLIKDKYTTSDNRISFDKDGAGFTITENGYELSLSVIGENASDKLITSEKIESLVTVNNHEEREEPLSTLSAQEKLEKIKNVDNRSTIRYSDIVNNTDVEYVLVSNDVKENIIVKSRSDSYSYDFILKLYGLYAEKNEDKSIGIYDSETDEKKYLIPAPYMYDANEVYSYDVDYTLAAVDGKPGVYILSVIADDEFINSDERQFPVTIDPTITTDKALTQDTYIDSNNPNTAYGSSTTLYVTTGRRIGYIRIEEPNLPIGAQITKTQLHVPYCFSSSYREGRADVAMYRMARNWSESTLTWNVASSMTDSSQGIYNGYYTSQIAFSSMSYSSNYPEWASFDITSTAQSWYSGAAENYGVALSRISGDIPDVHIFSQSVSSGRRAYMTVEFECHLPEGVYAIKNVALPSYYMMADAPDNISSAVVKKAQYTVSPTNDFTRSALFKISEYGNTDRYVIRSMLNNEYGLGYSGSGIITRKINTIDSLVGDGNSFYIEYDLEKDGFYIRPYNSSYVINLSTSSEELTQTSKTNSTSYSVWNFEQYTGIERNGGNVYASPIYAGESGVLYPYGWSTVIGRNEVSVWLSYGNGIVSYTWTLALKKLTLNAHDDGNVLITVRMENASNNICVDAFSFDFPILLRIEEGIYFIKNKEHGKYMQIDDGDSPNYNTSGAIMELWEFDAEDYQKWQLIHVWDGYYKIISVKSGLALCVQASHLNQTQYALVQEAYSDVSRKQWKITESSSGAYIIRPKSGEAYETDWCMCAGDTIAGTDGLNVEQRSYVNNNSYKDEWMLQAYHITLCGITNLGHNHLSCLETAEEILHNNGYTSIELVTGEVSSSDCMDYLKTANVFTIRSHGVLVYLNGTTIGLSTGIMLNDESDEDIVALYSHPWSGMTSESMSIGAADRFVNLDIALFIGCKTAYDGETGSNIVSVIENQGAKVAIGFSGDIDCNQANKWTEDFYSMLLDGATVQDAADFASKTQCEASGLDNPVIIGDGNYKLND